MVTKEMLMMSKEDLIASIIEADKQGKSLEASLKELVDVQSTLIDEAKKIGDDVDRGIKVMKALAMASIDMRKLLAEKYGSFVM